MQDYFFITLGFALKKISPAIIIPAPANCMALNLSPSKNPQIIATIGISKVTVDAKLILIKVLNLISERILFNQFNVFPVVSLQGILLKNYKMLSLQQEYNL